MTPLDRKRMYLTCLRAAERALDFLHFLPFTQSSARIERGALNRVAAELAMVTPPTEPAAVLRSEVEEVALNLACMAADALHPDRPTPDDAAFMGVVTTLRRALDEIVKETP